MYRHVLISFEKWDFSRRKKKEIERKLSVQIGFSLCLDEYMRRESFNLAYKMVSKTYEYTTNVIE